MKSIAKVMLFLSTLHSSSGNTAPAEIASTSTVSGAADVKIYHGTLPDVREYREVVAVELRRGDDRRLCSGVLIAPDVVLSAAHCVGNAYQPVRIAVTLDFSKAPPLREGDLSSTAATASTPEMQSIAVASFEVMNASRLSSGADLWGEDLLIIRLKRAIAGSAVPVRVAALKGIERAELVRVVGFGETETKRSGIKLFADMDVGFARCDPARATGEDANCARGAELLARDRGRKKDACFGDSGGPVYIRTGAAKYSLIGITSRPVESAQPCGAGTFVTLLDGARWQFIKQATGLRDPEGELTPLVPPKSQCVPPSCYTE